MVKPMSARKHMDRSDGSARERLLAAADELFYAEGVRGVGVDRLIARAGVAKASLYATFGSKDALVTAYLAGRGERRRALVEARIASLEDPRKRILAVFDLLGELAEEPGFRGCAFANASAEGKPSKRVGDACKRARGWVHTLFVGLASESGAPDPERLGSELALLYHGTNLVSAHQRDAGAARTARGIAQRLLDGLPKRR